MNEVYRWYSSPITSSTFMGHGGWDTRGSGYARNWGCGEGGQHVAAAPSERIKV